ncbi:MAG TPA: MBL fold metallo-hydrolase [Myxococcota bacterium]
MRGSVPTPGPSTQRYGGNTVCVEVRLLDGTLIVLDAGTGMRELGKKLMAEQFDREIHLFITHRHWDHVLGMPFFAPLYKKETHLLIHPYTISGYEAGTHPILFDGVHFPVRFEDIPANMETLPVQTGELRVGSARLNSIALNHPGGACGFRIDDDDGSSLCYLTDNELNPPYPHITPPKALAKFAENTGLMIHDAQYLPSDLPAKKGWGHSLVSECLDLAKMASARTVALHHHEPERDDAALDKIGHEATQWADANAKGLEVVVASETLTVDVKGR